MASSPLDGGSIESRGRGAVILLAICLSIGAAVAAAGVSGWSRSLKDLHCPPETEERAHEICGSIERNLKFTFFGHATISPGFKPNWVTVKDVWCEQHILARDVPILLSLAGQQDWRLASTASFLLRVLAGRGQYNSVEESGSVFDPTRPDYILKAGCAGSASHS